jgi:hypothetical protein
MQESHRTELLKIHPTIVGHVGRRSTRISRSFPAPVSVALPAKGEGEANFVQSLPLFENSGDNTPVELEKFLKNQPFTKSSGPLIVFDELPANKSCASTLHPSNRNPKSVPKSVRDWPLSGTTLQSVRETRPFVDITCVNRTPFIVKEQMAQQHTKT